MRDEPMTVADVARKAEWEGGVIEAIVYGVKPQDIADEKLRELWRDACERYELLDETVHEIEKTLDAARDEPVGGEL